MNTPHITKSEFDAFILANCSLHARNNPRIERDGKYSYECYDNDDGEEIAFISRSISAEDGEVDVEYVIKGR